MVEASTRSQAGLLTGGNGRDIIGKLIRETPASLSPFGRLLVVLNSVADLPRNLALMKSVGLEPRELAKRSIPLRPLFDWNRLDRLGGTSHGLYMVRDGRAYETTCAVEARLQ